MSAEIASLKREIRALRSGIAKIEDHAKFTSEPIYREVRFTKMEANAVRDERQIKPNDDSRGAL